MAKAKKRTKRAAAKRNGKKPRRGRPPHGVGSSVVGVRVSDPEHTLLVKAAKKMKVGISTYLRDAALAAAG
jgi:hypothetical protein